MSMGPQGHEGWKDYCESEKELWNAEEMARELYPRVLGRYSSYEELVDDVRGRLRSMGLTTHLGWYQVGKEHRNRIRIQLRLRR